MTLNDLKGLQMSLFVSNKLSEVIWDHLESSKSWGDIIGYSLKMQRCQKCTVFFWSVGTTDIGHWNCKSLVTFLLAKAPPIYLYLIIEISISWNLCFNLIFCLFRIACVACKNPVQKRQQMQFKNAVQKSSSKINFVK